MPQEAGSIDRQVALRIGAGQGIRCGTCAEDSGRVGWRRLPRWSHGRSGRGREGGLGNGDQGPWGSHGLLVSRGVWGLRSGRPTLEWQGRGTRSEGRERGGDGGGGRAGAGGDSLGLRSRRTCSSGW